MSTVALRTALIWNDEVMGDVVVEKPSKITLGATKRSTFVVPPLGLPPEFAIVRPGNRGYLLTLGEHMRGTVCLDGVQRDVAELVRTQSEGGFHATPISGRDWGVIELDESGEHKLFFQFVPLEEQPQFFTAKVVAAGLLGLLVSSAIVGLFFVWRGEGFAESGVRGIALSALALASGGSLWWLLRQDGDSQASFGFSVLLHAALLFATYELYDPTDHMVWPGRRDLTGDYLITRIQKADPPPEVQATVGAVAAQPSEAAAKSPNKPTNTATRNDEGAAGGKGETERARDPKPGRVEPPKEALLTETNERSIQATIHRSLTAPLANYNAIEGAKKSGGTGTGGGSGTGVGDGVGTGTTRGSQGKGDGGGGKSEGDFVTKKGPVDTGKERPGGNCVGPNCSGSKPREVKLALAGPSGDLAGYTEDEIKRVIKTREGIFRKCYQKELDRNPGLGGKLVVRFKIGADGTVQTATKAGGSTLSNDAVEECVTGNVGKLRFTPKGVVANVTFPFVYSQGGG